MTTTGGLVQAETFFHFALFYRGPGEYAREVCSFVREGLSSAEPVLVAVPGRRLDLVRGALGESAGAVWFADMTVLGRPTPASWKTVPGGPARTTPAPRWPRPSPPSPPPRARSTAFSEQDLAALREQVRRRAAREGLSSSRAQDLVTAVHEIAAN